MPWFFFSIQLQLQLYFWIVHYLIFNEEVMYQKCCKIFPRQGLNVNLSIFLHRLNMARTMIELTTYKWHSCCFGHYSIGNHDWTAEISQPIKICMCLSCMCLRITCILTAYVHLAYMHTKYIPHTGSYGIQMHGIHKYDVQKYSVHV
jgi:hypothetical protein